MAVSQFVRDMDWFTSEERIRTVRMTIENSTRALFDLAQKDRGLVGLVDQVTVENGVGDLAFEFPA